MSVAARIARLGSQAILPAAVLVGAWIATQAIIGAGESEPERRLSDPGSRETVFAVRAVDVALGEHRATFRAFGEIVAVGSAELRIASPGDVIAVHPDLAVGSVVDAGEALVTIDPFAYEGALRQARAELAEAEAGRAEVTARVSLEENAVLSAADQLDIAQRDLDRAVQLARSGSIADKALDDRRLLVSQRQQAQDQAIFTLEAEKARLAQQTAAVERLEWQVERAERALADTVLKAPYRAIVRGESAEVGRLLADNDIAVSLIRADALDVAFILSDHRYGRLLSEGPVAGTPVEVLWRIGDEPVRLPASITRTDADVLSNTGGIRLFARLDLEAAKERPVPRPGAFVEVLVPGPRHPATARLPSAALYGDAVYVIDDESRMMRRTVRLAARDGDDAILGGQLSTGDQVVITRLTEAGDGIKVKRVGGAAPAPPALAANSTPSRDGPTSVPPQSGQLESASAPQHPVAEAATPAAADTTMPVVPLASPTAPETEPDARPTRRTRRGPPAARPARTGEPAG